VSQPQVKPFVEACIRTKRIWKIDNGVEAETTHLFYLMGNDGYF